MLSLSKKIDNRWTWGPINEMSGEPRAFLLENVQARASTLFFAEAENADDVLLRVSKAMIECYPESIYGYSNLGTLYLVMGRYDEGERYLRQAEAIDPTDPIVRGNIGRLAELRGSTGGP
jgi:tetratricopeptide (TPR) repeat protein